MHVISGSIGSRFILSTLTGISSVFYGRIYISKHFSFLGYLAVENLEKNKLFNLFKVIVTLSGQYKQIRDAER